MTFVLYICFAIAIVCSSSHCFGVSGGLCFVFVAFSGYLHLFFLYLCIMKTCLYNFDPLKPHFYIVKLGFTGVYIIFHILLKR